MTKKLYFIFGGYNILIYSVFGYFDQQKEAKLK